MYFSTRCAITSVSVSVTNLWPFGDELLLQLHVIFDDSVVHDDDIAGAIAMRVRIFFSRTAVRGPARVAQAVCAINRRKPNDFFKIAQFSRSAANIHFAVVRPQRRFRRNRSRDIQGGEARQE